MTMSAATARSRSRSPQHGAQPARGSTDDCISVSSSTSHSTTSSDNSPLIGSNKEYLRTARLADVVDEASVHTLGPAKLSDLLRFPLTDMATAIVGPADECERMNTNIRLGFHIDCRFAGAATVEVMHDMFSRAGNLLGIGAFVGSATETPSVRPFHGVSSCEKAHRCHKIYKMLPETVRPDHVYMNQMNFVHPEALVEMEKVEWPSKADYKADSIAAMGKSMEAVQRTCKILDDKDLSFPPTVQAHCLMCDGPCKAILNKAAPEVATDSHRRAEETWAGVECPDYSVAGDGMRWAGKTVKNLIVCIKELKAKRKDTIVIECTVKFDPSFVKYLLESGSDSIDPEEVYTMRAYTICPSSYGHNVPRRRMYLIITRDAFHNITREFTEWHLPYLRHVMIPCRAYFVEHAEIVQQALHDKIAKNPSVLEGRDDEPITFFHTLTAHQQQRVFDYGTTEIEKLLGPTNGVVSLTGPAPDVDFTCDADSNPDSRYRCGHRTPTLLTTNVFWNNIMERPALKREYPSMQGLSTIPSAHADEFLVPYDLDKLSETDVIHMMGNAMHLEVIYLIRLWLLCCCQRKSIPEPVVVVTESLNSQLFDDSDEDWGPQWPATRPGTNASDSVAAPVLPTASLDPDDDLSNLALSLQ
jgi:hypothetical protein